MRRFESGHGDNPNCILIWFRKSGMSRKHVATGHNQIDPLDFLPKSPNDGESQVTLAASIYHESICNRNKPNQNIIIMESINRHQSNEDIDMKSILIQLAFGFAAGIAFIAVCGFAEWVHDLIVK